MLPGFFRLLVLGFALAGGSVLSAQAGPAYHVQDQPGSGYFNPENHYSPIAITVDNTTLSVLAGQFHLEKAPLGSTAYADFLTFCLQPNVLLAPFDNPYYQGSFAVAAGGIYSVAVGTTTVGNMIKDLWSLFYADIGTGTAVEKNVKAAAFQVAVWELAYDNGSKNLASGKFKMGSGNGTQNAVMAQAQNYLAPVDGLGSLASIEVLWDNGAGADRQDLIIEIPQPQALSLFAFALLGLAALRRRLIAPMGLRAGE